MAHPRNESNSAASLVSSDIDYRLLPDLSQIPHGGDDECLYSTRQQLLQHDTLPLGYSHAVLPENGSQPKTGFAQRFYARLKGLFPKGVSPDAWGAWRTGVIMCALAAAISFLVNTSAAIWFTTKFGINQGIGTIYHGSCAKAESMSRWLHLGINVLSTILLSGSNYCMQCLAAPTRKDIDYAHGQGLWVDIGVQSARNFGIMGPGRAVLWWCLALSSGPLHLMYNSAIFSSLATNEYSVTIVPQDKLSLFLDGGYQNFTDHNPNLYQNLTKKRCMQDYGVKFLSARSDVIVIVDAPRNSTNSTTLDIWTANGLVSLGFDWVEGSFDGSWLCGFFNSVDHGYECDIENAIATVETWNLAGFPVQFCLSEETEENCSVQFSRGILIVVIICNAVKCICMVLAALNLKQRPLITIGDAISSFLKSPDPATSGMCIATKRDFQKEYWVSTRAGHAREAPCRTWYPYGHRWFSAVSVTRWLICTLVALFGMVAIIVILCLTLPTLPNLFNTSLGLQSLWSIGFGTVDSRTMSTGRGDNPYGSLISCVILANSAQLMISTLYLLYNSIFTSMVLADEWDRLSYEPKTLRVTQPTSGQRSSYFLSLPYKYTIPLLVASGGIHWLTSQSIFLAMVTEYSSGQGEVRSVTTIGYSPIAIICALASGCVLLLAAFANGFRRYSGRMPLVGSCSAAISAACHPGPEGPVDVLSALQWGAVKTHGDIGHCTFSNKYPVPPPIPGKLYAGTTLKI